MSSFETAGFSKRLRLGYVMDVDVVSKVGIASWHRLLECPLAPLFLFLSLPFFLSLISHRRRRVWASCCLISTVLVDV